MERKPLKLQIKILHWGVPIGADRDPPSLAFSLLHQGARRDFVGGGARSGAETRHRLQCLLEQVADARGADDDEPLDELG